MVLPKSAVSKLCEKMTSRLRKNQKDTKNEEEEYNAKTDCPVPYISCVCKGSPLPHHIDGPAGGIRMRCKNDQCHLAKILLHRKCFNQLEETLLKILSNLGSARGWTDAQLKSNLWEKKGQTLIAKLLRCHCGQGLMSLDVEYYKKRDLEEQRKQQLESAKQRKKKCTKNKLPVLNFNNSGPVAPELIQNDFVPIRRFSYGQTSHSTSALNYGSQFNLSDDCDSQDTFDIRECSTSTSPQMLVMDKAKHLKETQIQVKPTPLFRSRKDTVAIGKGRKSWPSKSSVGDLQQQQKTTHKRNSHKESSKYGQTVTPPPSLMDKRIEILSTETSLLNMGNAQQLKGQPGRKTGKKSNESIGQKKSQPISLPSGLEAETVFAVPREPLEDTGHFYSLFDPHSPGFFLGEILLGESRLPGLISLHRLVPRSA